MFKTPRAEIEQKLKNADEAAQDVVEAFVVDFEKSPDALCLPPRQSLLSLMLSDDSLSESSTATDLLEPLDALVDSKSAYLSDASWGFAASKKKESLTGPYLFAADNLVETSHWVDVHSHMIW